MNSPADSVAELADAQGLGQCAIVAKCLLHQWFMGEPPGQKPGNWSDTLDHHLEDSTNHMEATA